MQVPNIRYLLLTVILLFAAGLYVGLGDPRSTGQARLPDAETIYAIDGWSSGPSTVEEGTNHTSALTRGFVNPSGVAATLTVFANGAPKLYAAGGEVPFLGNGYLVATPPPDLVPPPGEGMNVLVAQRASERWLVMYAYGERRGLLGNGPLPWTLALMDGLAGAPNEYYKLYLMVRADRLDAKMGRDVSDFAGLLFPRIQAWYAA